MVQQRNLRAIAMNYIDTDTTLTDSSEYGLQNETERCPITGVSRVPGYIPAWLSSDSPVDSRAERLADAIIHVEFEAGGDVRQVPLPEISASSPHGAKRRAGHGVPGAGIALFPLQFDEYLLHVFAGRQALLSRVIEVLQVYAADAGNITNVSHELGTRKF